MPLPPTFDLNAPAVRRDPFPYYALLRRQAPVFLSQPAGQLPLWYVTGSKEVEQVLGDTTRFARDARAVSAPFAAAMFQGSDAHTLQHIHAHLLNRDGAEHRRLRRLVSQAFTPRAVAAMRPRIQSIADDLLQAVHPAGRMELIGDYAFHLPIITIAELLGVPAGDRDDFRRWSEVLIRPAGEDRSAVDRCYRELPAYLLALMAHRRACPGPDLISTLLHAEAQGEALGASELCSMVAFLLMAGHETSASLIANAVLTLLQAPATLARLIDTPALLPRAIEELLRYDSPVERAMVRYVTQDTQLAGQSLARGQLVVPVIAAVNRDEARYARADTLDIDRPRCPHLSFGSGPHYCLGAPLARLETEVALATLLRRCPGLQLAAEVDTLTWVNTPNFRRPEQVPLRWRPA